MRIKVKVYEKLIAYSEVLNYPAQTPIEVSAGDIYAVTEV